MDKIVDMIRAKSNKISAVVAVLSLAYSIATGVVRDNTHLKDRLEDQEKRLSVLEDSTKKDMATRQELKDLGTRLDQRLDDIKDMLKVEIDSHKNKR